MNGIIEYALKNNPFFQVSKHGLWLGCEDKTEKSGYTCVVYFDTMTIGL